MDGIRCPVYRWPLGRKAKDAAPVGVAAWVIVDPEDASLLGRYRWYLAKSRDGNVYVGRYVREYRGTAYLHREILGLPPFPGRGADRVEVDHIGGDGLDNRRANLRTVTHAQNMQNQKLHATNTSGHRGVSWYSKEQCWRVMVGSDGRRRNLGMFREKADAVATAAAFYREHVPYAVGF